MTNKKRYQPRSPDRKPRTKEQTLLLERAQDKVAQVAEKYGCSRSWVTACIISAYFGVELPRFDRTVRKRRKATK